MTIQLRGITWDDPRGWGPLAEVGRAFAATSAGRDIRISWDIQPLEGFESRPVPELAREYDLLNLDHPHLGEAVAGGSLEPVGDLADEFVGPSLASYRWAGWIWAVPVDAACQVSAWHPARLDAPPRSYAEVLELARTKRVAASLAGLHSLMALLTLLAQNGTPLPQDPREDWPAPEAFGAAALRLRELAAVCLPESLDWNPLRMLAAMAEGRCDYAVFTFAYVSFQKSGVRFAPVPGGSGAVLGGTGLAVSAHSPNPDAALAYARFAGSASVQQTIWPQHGGQPAHREAWDALPRIDPFYCALRPAVESAWVRPRYPGWIRRQAEAGRLINNWLRNGAADTGALRSQLQNLWRETQSAV